MRREAGPNNGPGLMVLGVLAVILVPVVSAPIARLHARLVGKIAPVLMAPLPETGELLAIKEFLESDSPNPDQAALILERLGLEYRLPFTLMTLGLVIAVRKWNSKLDWRAKRDMASILRISAEHFKCLSPIVKCGPITKKENFKGEWALAKTPVQFALEAGLLKDDLGRVLKVWDVLSELTGLPLERDPMELGSFQLDMEALRMVLVGQLGNVMPDDPRSLPPHQKGLAAAFLAHWRDDKTSAMRIFDSLSESWEPLDGEAEPKSGPRGKSAGKAGAKDSPKTGGKSMGEAGVMSRGGGQGERSKLERASASSNGGGPYQLDTAAADQVLDDLDKNSIGGLKALAASVGHRSFVNVWFMALLALARTKGALPSSMWIWLKPTDRALFYALNQVGGRTAWVEAAGAWSHLEAERAKAMILKNPVVETAVEALVKSLADEGWIKRPESLKPCGVSNPGGQSSPQSAGGGGQARSGEILSSGGHGDCDDPSIQLGGDSSSAAGENPSAAQSAKSAASIFGAVNCAIKEMVINALIEGMAHEGWIELADDAAPLNAFNNAGAPAGSLEGISEGHQPGPSICFPEGCQPAPLVGSPEGCQPASLVGSPEGCQPAPLVGSPEGCQPEPAVGSPEGCQPEPAVGSSEGCQPEPAVGSSEGCQPGPLFGFTEGCQPTPSVGFTEGGQPEPSVGFIEGCQPEQSVGFIEGCQPGPSVGFSAGGLQENQAQTPIDSLYPLPSGEFECEAPEKERKAGSVNSGDAPTGARVGGRPIERGLADEAPVEGWRVDEGLAEGEPVERGPAQGEPVESGLKDGAPVEGGGGSPDRLRTSEASQKIPPNAAEGIDDWLHGGESGGVKKRSITLSDFKPPPPDDLF